jgi:hypothetical protein
MMFQSAARSVVVLVATLGALACASGSSGPQNLAGEDAAPASTLDGGYEAAPGEAQDSALADTGNATCDGGSCASACPGQLMACPGLGCIDVSADKKNCGGCGVVCTAPDAGGAGAVCSNGQCALSCPSGSGPTVQACAGEGCVDVSKSAANCGACGNACGAGQTCTNGVCCGGTSKLCGGSCIDVTTDSANCGSCNHACSTGGHCAGGKCVGYSVAMSTPSSAGVDACTIAGHQTLLTSSSGWEESAVISLPIAFTFFGDTQTQFWIGSQGTVGFGMPPSGAFSYPNCPLPDSSNMYGAAIAFGDSIDTGTAGVCYATTGMAPNRKLVLTWDQATHESDTGSVLTFSIVLDEATSSIEFQYDTATPGMSGGGYVRGNYATVGLQDPTGMAAAQYACGTGSNDLFNATPFQINFVPM